MLLINLDELFAECHFTILQISIEMPLLVQVQTTSPDELVSEYERATSSVEERHPML